MNKEALLDLFSLLHQRKITPEKAIQEFKFLPYHDLGIAKVDTHRATRTGLSEIILSEKKTPSQVVLIARKLIQAHGYAVASRVSRDHVLAAKKAFKKVRHNEDARMLFVGQIPDRGKRPGITVITAGTADIPVAEEAAVVAELMGNQVERVFDVGVAGVHRLLDQRSKIEPSKILIVVAGMEGALPSIVAGIYGKPVIAVPTSVGYGASFQGVSALLTMLNTCALGISVVNIDNGVGAGYLAGILNAL